MSEILSWSRDGEAVLSIVPPIPEDAPPTIREGIARRRLVATGKPCPCGARPLRPNRAQRRRAAKTSRVTTVYIVHENGCPAVTETLTAAIARWKGLA